MEFRNRYQKQESSNKEKITIFPYCFKISNNWIRNLKTFKTFLPDKIIVPAASNGGNKFKVGLI